MIGHTAPRVGTTTRPEVDEEVRVRLLPPYNVIIENDDHHSMVFVVGVICKVFGYPVERALQLMLEAHTTGRAIVWTGSKEVAELKVDQVSTNHEIRAHDQAKLGPLTCYLEPAPGA